MGRPKGSKNARCFHAEDLALEMGVDPLRFLFEVANGNYPEYDMHRITAAKEACKYLYPTKQAIAVTVPDAVGFKVVIEDYTKK